MPAVKLSLAAIERQTQRRGPAYAEAVKSAGEIHGDTIEIDGAAFQRILEAHPARIGLGDVVEIIAKPIAMALGLDCLETDGRLKPDSDCAKRRDALNRF